MRIGIDHPTNRPNFTTVRLGELVVWFSYETMIAAELRDTQIVRVNVWGPTTGQHLNAVDGGSREAHKRRLSIDAFEGAIEAMLSEAGMYSLAG